MKRSGKPSFTVNVWGNKLLDTFVLESEIKDVIRDFTRYDPKVETIEWPN